MKPVEVLATAFSNWGLPADAADFLLQLWNSAQFLDDVKDGHAIVDVDEAIYTVAVAIPCHEFLARHRAALAGALVSMYHKWQAANVAEAARCDLDKAYMWRAGYYDVVLLALALCMNRETVEQLAPQVMALYGESRDDYLKEFSGA